MDDTEPVSDDERRRFRRVGSSLRCWIRGGSRTVYVTLRDISHGGLGIRAPTTFQRGDAAEVLLEDAHHARSLRARAEVAWSHPDTDNPEHAGTGVRFLEVIEGQELLPPRGDE
jgi:c-di-GMP-binding flagellar brake protein YcgR